MELGLTRATTCPAVFQSLRGFGVDWSFLGCRRHGGLKCFNP
ncbi:hypothetical protein GFS31_43720 (plasmid) [Leptolyngbya sp. BL0902]|nr:hypothetical protein GFS31_43720 [Leptolyngbya sp. BL0902]